MMAIGSVFGRGWQDSANWQNSHLYKQSYTLSRHLYQRIATEYRGPTCEVAQTGLYGMSYNLWDLRGYAAFEEAGTHIDKSPSMTGNVAVWTVEFLLGV